uniref:Uncharacterized protein n=1 Tax=Anguilla anguilla TaxID=7936 RepID=A0A0E9UYC1_ANGAN
MEVACSLSYWESYKQLPGGFQVVFSAKRLASAPSRMGITHQTKTKKSRKG